uniref:PCI domain-containing protein n=1 Tax=Manihot esculenta TaxID=3983 RepID=A0A199UAB6_MANES
MATYDLTPRIAPNLDRHLVFPLLEFLQERQLYPEEQIFKSKIELLSKTNMVDYAMDIHKSLYHTEDVPQDMIERRAEVVARLKALEEGAAPLVAFLQNVNAVQELRADKQYNLQMLNDRFQIGPKQIEALYQYAKFQFECGNYSGAADYLYLSTAFMVNKRRRPQFKDFIKVDVILNDPFLGKRVEDINFSTVPMRDEFLENARLFIFETYCRIHQRINMGVLAEKLNLNYEEAERWIVNLIRNSKLDAKIDSQSGTVIMEPNQPNVYEQLIDHTKAISGRTYKLVGQLLEHAHAQAAR